MLHQPTRRSGLVTAALVTTLVLPALAQVPAPPPVGETSRGAMMQRASDRIKALQREADQLAQQSKTTLAALRQLELTRALRTEELAAVNTRLAAVSAKVAASTARVQALEAQRVDRTPALEERLQALYKRGRNGYVRLLLDTADERDLARASRGVVSLARIEEIRVAEHRRLLAEEQVARAQLQSEERQVARLQAEAANLEAAAVKAVAERGRMLDELDRRRELAAQYVGELEQARQRLQSTLDGLEGTAIVDLPLRPFQGALPWPLAGPVLTRFGRSTTGSFGTSIQRNGIEIGAVNGSPVRAVHGGTVAYAAPFTGYGVMVILDHGQDAFSVYGHLSGTALRPGLVVARGQAVGTSGTTPAGEAAAYFEVRIDGRPVNPVQWLRRTP
jgi:septal ring factor EnvC (AmiA/AmiB activator)